MKQKERKHMKMKAFKHYGTVAALAVIILIFSILRPASFCTVKNFLNISRQAAPLAMVALGATFVMTINEFDLSIGNIVSLGGVIAALLSIKQVPVALCFLIAAVICLLVGCVNGIVVARFQILSLRHLGCLKVASPQWHFLRSALVLTLAVSQAHIKALASCFCVR